MSDSGSSRLRLPSKISRPCSAAPQKQTPSPLSPTSAMNSSTVLTEDTDSFIIGDRVWVGGTKPGSIAYIGETQFAPGDWAGVVLDEPIGKNDGSVAGSRYFQCEPKRGIFSRLTRLTRQPLSETTLPTGEKTPTSSVYGSRTNLSKSMSTSLHSSVTSLSSVSQKDVTIGDRVIVSSSQGSKAGVLRFMGPTQFASGEWCGVELDEPVGKNDGSVEEIRYFECRPKYGLFAPLHKVSRSPSSRRTSSTCILHKPGGSLMTTPPGRLSGSRESVKSTSSRISTAGSSAIRGMAPGSREMLKEKQQEIEMLRHERELDRQRISRVAAQADNAERNVITLKEDYDKYKELMELQIQETQTALAQFLLENNSLKVQLDEEKQKNEDLLFRFEEGSINMDDIQVINSQNEDKMKDLEKQLMEERERVIRLEQDNSKLLEARDELAKLRAELSMRENSKSQELQDIEKTHTEANSMLEKQVLERDKLIERYEQKIQEFEARIRNFESEIVDQAVEQKNLQEKIDLAQQSLLEKNSLIEKLRKESEKEVKEFQGQIDQLNTMMETIKKENNEKTNSDNIVVEKQLLERDNLIEQLKKQIQDFEAKIQSYESEAAAQTSFHKNLQETFNAVEKNLQEKSALTEKLQKELELNLEESQREIEHLKSRIETITQENTEKEKSLAEQLQQQQNVVESLKKETLETRDSGNVLEQKLLEREKLIEKHEKYIGDCEAKIQSFESEVVDQSVLQKNLQDSIEAMNQNLEGKNTLLEKLRKDYDVDLENSKKQIEELKEEIKKIKEQNTADKKSLVEKIEQEKAMTEKMAKESIEQKTAEYQVLEKQLIERMSEENKKQIEEFKGKLEKSETEVAAQTAIQKSLHEKIEALERDLAEKNAFVEKLQRENEVNGKRYENEIQQLNEMIEKITTQSIETKNSENIMLQKQLLESKKLMEEKETKIQDYESNIKKYEADAEAQRGAQKNLQQSIEEMQQNLLEKEKLMENLKKEYDVSLEASESQIEQLKEMIESITKKSNDEKESLVEQINEKQKIVENVTKEIEDERKLLSEKMQQLETKMENETRQKDEEQKSLVAQIEELKTAIKLAATTSDSEKKSLVEQIEQRQALIENLSKQSNEETKSLVEQIEQLKNTNHKISQDNSEEKKSLVAQIEELKKNNENITKESNEEKKALTEKLEELQKTFETSTKESVEEKNTLAEQIELSKKEIELVTKRKNEEQESLLQKIEQLSKMLENATKQIGEEKEPLVKEIEELKKKMENMSKESSEEKKSLVDQIQQQENTIESLTKETSEEKKLLIVEIEQLKQLNEQKTGQNLDSQKSLLQKIEQQQNEMENMKKKNTEEQKSLLEEIEQRQNLVESLEKQSSQLVEQIERLSGTLEKIQEERSIEKNSLVEEHRKKLAEMEESSRSRLVELETEKSQLQAQTTDRINEIANNYKTLLNHDIEIADIVQLLERKSDDIQLIVRELSVRRDKRSALGQGGENVEESSTNVKTHEKHTLESKIPSGLKKPEKSLRGMDKGLSVADDEALESGPKICDDLEKRMSLLQGECQSSKIPNLDKQGVEMRKSIEKMKKNFGILLDEEKKLQMSITVKKADLEKLGAAMNVLEREKHGANVDSANTKFNNETLEQEATRGTKGNSLQSVASEENLLTDFEDKTAMESLAGSEIAVKELRARFLEFVKTLKKNKNAESNASVGLKETESSMQKIEELVKNSAKCFAEKMKERSELSNELQAQIHSLKSTLKELASVLNKKNNLMEVTANPSENIVSQSESNAKRIDELDHNELEQLLADNETYKGQIDFLNSVIVDMQRKNETLTCKIEVLQLGVPASEADDYSRTTLSKRMTAPRMFCDICDQFDLHETEDCSRQAQDYEQPEPTKNSPKKSPVERAYCESCECFGHDTSECDNSETY